MVVHKTDVTAMCSFIEKKEPGHKHESDNDLVVLNSCSTFMCEESEVYEVKLHSVGNVVVCCFPSLCTASSFVSHCGILCFCLQI